MADVTGFGGEHGVQLGQAVRCSGMAAEHDLRQTSDSVGGQSGKHTDDVTSVPDVEGESVRSELVPPRGEHL